MTGVFLAPAWFLNSAVAELLAINNQIFLRASACFPAKGSCLSYESGAAEPLVWGTSRYKCLRVLHGMVLAICNWFLLPNLYIYTHFWINAAVLKSFLRVIMILSFSNKLAYT